MKKVYRENIIRALGELASCDFRKAAWLKTIKDFALRSMTTRQYAACSPIGHGSIGLMASDGRESTVEWSGAKG